MNTPATENLEVVQGDTLRVRFNVRDAAGPVDLTGSRARLQVRSSPTAPAASISLSETAGLVLSFGAVDALFAAAQTAALPGTVHVYELELTSSGGDVHTIAGGDFSVRTEIAR